VHEGDPVARKATAQDVADLAGVSRSAVSLVLNGRAEGHIAALKQQAVLEAARLLTTPRTQWPSACAADAAAQSAY
jgi:transcriptional regulator with XRE-family HTH domain